MVVHPTCASPRSHALLHFKLKEIHFLVHSNSETAPPVSGNIHTSSTSQTNLQYFAFNLAHISVRNLQSLDTFNPIMDTAAIIVFSK